MRKKKKWRVTKTRTNEQSRVLANEFLNGIREKHVIWQAYITPIRKANEKAKREEYENKSEVKAKKATWGKEYRKKPEVKAKRKQKRQAERDDALKNKTYYCEHCFVRVSSKSRLTRHNKTSLWHANKLSLKQYGFQSVIDDLKRYIELELI